MIKDNPWIMVGALAIENNNYNHAKRLAHCVRGAERLGVSWSDIISLSRKADIVDARRLCCSYLYDHAWTLKKIAKELGYENHTSVLYQKNKTQEFLKIDKTFQWKYTLFHNA
jgi:chromosomal replication initiation ATPase DnaA|tara:strand:- start:377 stop:715 length:339 start_codon:yes stop_codon:yes gene_type:complete